MSTQPRIDGVALSYFSDDDILHYVIDNDLLQMLDLRGIFRGMDIFDRQYQFDRIRDEARRLGVRVS